MLGIVAAVTLAPRLVRGTRAKRLLPGVAVGAALLASAWGIAGAVSAGTSSNSFSQDFINNLPSDLRWVDHAVGGKPVKSKVTRRISVSFGACGDGASCSTSSRARTKASIEFANCDFVLGTTGLCGGTNAQC